MIVTLFEAVQKAYTRPEQIIDADWPVVAEFLTTFNKCNAKEEMQLFNLWEFNQTGELGRRRIYENGEPTENYETIPNTIRRCKTNADAVWGIVLDYDGKEKIEDAIRSLSGFEFCLYTTFRHSEEQNKFRVVLPFKSRTTPEVFKRKKESLAKTFQAVDHSSFSESQSFYLHSGPDESKAFAYWGRGEFLDLDVFEDTPEPVFEERPPTEYTGDGDMYKAKLIKSLTSCSGLHYANESSKYGVLTLVAMCKSAGISFAEYDTICWAMAAPDSSLQNAGLRKTAWIDWNPHNGITAKVREEFIKSYGGTSEFGKERPKSVEELKQFIIKKYGTGVK